MHDLIGQKLGQYRIVEQLGKGGMATVYKAFQPSLERYVAIKVLPPYFSHEEGFDERFVREAKAIARLDHPHILPIYDHGKEGQISYIAMRYVEAGTLKDMMDGQALPLARAVDVVEQVADALGYAHERGVIHRDVKPANILMDRRSWVLLTDFGLAKMAEGSQQLTASGVGVGTPAYMSPEQGKGQPIDRRTDVYSLGIVLFEMLTGRVPYEAETPLAVVLKHVTEPLPLPRAVNPDIPEGVELVILKTLAKDPDDRYQSVSDVAAALCRAAADAQSTAPVAAPVFEPTLRPVAPTLGDELVEPSAMPDRVETSAEPEPGPTTRMAEAPTVAVESAPTPTVARATADIPPVSSSQTSDKVPAAVVERPPTGGGPAVVTAVAAPPKRRVPWWPFAVAAVLVLACLAAGLWLVARGGWKRLASDPLNPSPPTGVPTTAPWEAAPAEEDEGEVPRPDGDELRLGIALSTSEDTVVDAQPLERQLSEQVGVPVSVYLADDDLVLADLLRERHIDVALLPTLYYLWLRDDEGYPLYPVLYADPLYAGIAVVGAESDLYSVQDLRGQPVALVSWDAPGGILGRAALMEEGLDLDRESEVLYLQPDFSPEASADALELVLDGRVRSAIVHSGAIEMAAQRRPEAAHELRVLGESRPTSWGTLAAWDDLSVDQLAALAVALDELGDEWSAGMTPYGRLVFTDEPMADNLAWALASVGLTAGQWVHHEPPAPWVPPELPPAAEHRPLPSAEQPLPPGGRPPRGGELRIAIVPPAGVTAEEDRFYFLLRGAMERANEELGLELVHRDTPEGGHPAETAMELIRSGYNVIVAAGWRDPASLREVADTHPEAHYLYFGHAFEEPPPNLASYIYRMDEMGYLMGALAGGASESRRVAIVAGQRVPAIEQMVEGFAAGLQGTCPECEPIIFFTDTFVGQDVCVDAGRHVVEEGADVVANAAGACGSAALRAAAQAGAWVIGVDWNEYQTTFRGGSTPHADRVLGSVVLGVGPQLREAIVGILRDRFEPGTVLSGVAEGGIEFVPSPGSGHPRQADLERQMKLVSKSMEDRPARP
jgi:serine/threonine protein kinase/basic membrane lipoprotein Med (substrate-binding protein (PBP1-ABC) superfamily)/ABC-type phosphate/phosphonate transport system substrate-binding protein